MEITLERLKMIIGDKECQIQILNSQITQLSNAYNELNEKYKNLEKQSETDEVVEE